jgi:hypothetical protein
MGPETRGAEMVIRDAFSAGINIELAYQLIHKEFPLLAKTVSFS